MTAPNKMAKRAAAGTLALAVCLTGGAIGAGAANAAAGFKFDQRIQGETRFETAIEASKAAFKASGDAKAIVIVNGDREVDGLTASYVAGVRDASILYVGASSISAATKAEMERLGTKNVYIVGGTTVVSSSLESQLKTDGYTVVRYGGDTRYDTAAAVATSNGTTKPGKVFLASGERLADALVISPIVTAKDYPILLTEPDGVPSATRSALNTLDVTTRIAVGGTTVLPDSVYTSAGATLRLSGASRQGTAIKVADEAIKSEGFKKDSIALVGNGNNNAADALVAAPLAAKEGIPLLFADAGTETTTQDYLKSRAAELTGKGYVFGGTSAVSSAAAEAATKAAQGGETPTPAANTYTVLSNNAATNTFVYSDPATKANVTATYANGDVFSVDGGEASLAVFEAALSAGDVVTIAKDSPSAGKTTFSLVSSNTTSPSGLIGNVNTGASTFAFIDPVSGQATIAGVSYAPSFALYTVDGASVPVAAFVTSLNTGDRIVVSGGDGSTAEKTRTFALTNQVTTGTVETAAAAFTIKTAAGATLGTFTADAGDLITIDGKGATAAEFALAVSTGDAVTYGKVADKESIALTNAAPTSVVGTYQTFATDTITYFTGAGTETKTIDISAGDPPDAVGNRPWTYKVNGVTVTLDEFKAAATAGDEIVFQVEDSKTDTKSSILLTDKPLSGKIGTVNAGAGTAQVLVGETAAVLATANFSSGSSFFFPGNTTKTFFVNGSGASQSQFEAEIVKVGNESKTGTLSVTDNGTTTELRLVSTTATVAPSALTAPVAGSQTSLTLTFNNRVYASGTPAASDFIIKNGAADVAYVSASPTTLAGASTTVTLNIAATTFVTGTGVSVELTPAGAAKFLDEAGKPATPKTINATVVAP